MVNVLACVQFTRPIEFQYEEDMEKSERWGKPHVSSLSFHSLLELRRGFAKGKEIKILLDLKLKYMLIYSRNLQSYNGDVASNTVKIIFNSEILILLK